MLTPRRLAPWLPPFVILGLWHLASQYVGASRLPSPTASFALLVSSATRDAIIEAQGGGSRGFLPHVVSTTYAVVIGVGLGGISAVFLALAVERFVVLRSVTEAGLALLKGLPPLLFVPFAAISLAGTDDVRSWSVLIYSHVTLLIYALNGLSSIDKNLIYLSALLGAGNVRTALRVKLPAMLPGLMGPFRLVTAFGLGVAIVAEYLVTPSGVGRVMKYALAFSNVGLIVVGVLWTVLIAFAIDGIIVTAFGVFLKGTDRKMLTEWMARQRGD